MSLRLCTAVFALISPALASPAVWSAEPAAKGASSTDAYRELAGEIEKHWKDELLPLWFPRAIDQERGGFYSQFNEDWSRGDRNDKTIVYQARMTWVCAQVAMRYPELRPQYLKYTRHGVDCLERVLWDREHGGFYWGLDEKGQVVDRYGTEKHAYGISFGIYGLAAAYKATKDARALEMAKRTFAWLDRHGHDGRNGGYYEAFARDGSVILAPAKGGKKTDQLGTQYGFKSMNSHIHLLEALTELYGVWPDPKLEARLREVFGVVRDKVAVEPGCLNLYFTPDWRAVPDHDSFGHDVETAYLLLEAAEALKQASDARTNAVAKSLVDHGLEWGWDNENGGFYDRGAAFSAAWAREKVWWTQADGLNALLLMHEKYGSRDPRYFKAFLQQWDFIRKHQVDATHGGWHNTVSAEGHAEPGRPKATIWKAAYHDGRALMNVAERLRKLSTPGKE